MPFEPNKIVDKNKDLDANKYLPLNAQDRQTFKDWATEQNHLYLLMQATRIEREETYKARDDKRMRENPALTPLIQQQRATSAIQRAQARTEDGPRSKHKHNPKKK